MYYNVKGLTDDLIALNSGSFGILYSISQNSTY